MSIEIFVYNPSVEEVVEVVNSIRLRTARLAQVDPERLCLKVNSFQAFGSPGAFFWRVSSGELFIKETTGWVDPSQKILWLCKQVMIEEKRLVIPNNLGILEFKWPKEVQ